MATCAAFAPSRIRSFSDMTAGRFGGLAEEEPVMFSNDASRMVIRHTFLELVSLESQEDCNSDAASCCGSTRGSESTRSPTDASESASWASMTDDELEPEVKPCGPPGSFVPARVEAPANYTVSIWGKQKRKAPAHTSVVLKNLPENCTNAVVLELLAEAGLTGQYDFLYVPTDFRNFSAFGYCFVNFLSHEQATFAITRLSQLEIAGTALEASWCADHQGYAVHVRRYRNSPVMHASVPEAYKPMIFKNGVQQSFPAPTKKIKEPRLRRGAPVERH